LRILYTNGGATPIRDLAIEKLKAAGHEVVFFNLVETEDDISKHTTKHFQMYQRILDYADNGNFDILYWATIISVPEYLLFELKARPNFKPKIIFNMFLRGLDRSLARCIALKELIDMPQVIKAVSSAMIVKDLKLPENFLKAGVNLEKLRIVSEPWTYEVEDLTVLDNPEYVEHSRAYFGFEPGETVVLLSGTWAYIKGVDIFVEALKYLSQDMLVVIHKHNYGLDRTLDVNLLDKAVHNHPNIRILDKWYSAQVHPLLFRAADIVVCAHRRSYTYGGSGVPALASRAKRLIVAPDFYFFNEIIKRYKIGVTYEPENPLSMARAIEHLERYYSAYEEEAKFEEVYADYQESSDIPAMVMREL